MIAAIEKNVKAWPHQGEVGRHHVEAKDSKEVNI